MSNDANVLMGWANFPLSQATPLAKMFVDLEVLTISRTYLHIMYIVRYHCEAGPCIWCPWCPLGLPTHQMDTHGHQMEGPAGN